MSHSLNYRFLFKQMPWNALNLGITIKNRMVQRTIVFILVAISIILYASLAYSFNRQNFSFLLSAIAILVCCYVFFYRVYLSTTFVFWAGLTFRLVFLLSLPALSDDYFRFIWDGLLSQDGISPYLVTPEQAGFPGYPWFEKLRGDKVIIDLYNSMNSQKYFSIYPTFNQLVFYLSTLNFKSIPGSVVIIRIFVIIAEVFIFRLLLSWAINRKLRSRAVLLYWFNPVVILEFSGNLHFEVFMLLFILLAFWFLDKEKLIPSALMFSLAVITKLHPLLLLPLIIKRLGLRKGFQFSLVVFSITCLSFYLFASQGFFDNYLRSFLLYFKSFEFNSALLYFMRMLAEWSGSELSENSGSYMAVVAAISILFISFIRKETNLGALLVTSGLAYSIFFLFSTTVHPWYLLPLMTFSLFCNCNFSVSWPIFAMFTYYTYRQVPYDESQLVVFIEYFMVLVVFLYDLKRKHFRHANH